jgi:hypothetical protein
VTKEQVFELMKFLRNVFPSFDFDQDKLNTWHRLLKDQDPAKVMMKAEWFAIEQKFPPALADLRERKLSYQTNILSEIEEWERNAARKQ